MAQTIMVLYFNLWEIMWKKNEVLQLTINTFIYMEIMHYNEIMYQLYIIIPLHISLILTDQHIS